MQKTYIKYLLLFFLPVILINLGIEAYVRLEPSGYLVNAKYLSTSADSIEVLSLGSSQVKDAINPEWIDRPLLNMASGNQHHDSDFALLKGVVDKLPKLETVIFEVSYSHFELPHNGKYFWKKSAYLHFYDINAYGRKTWFKDRLIFLSNPQFFARKFFADSTDNSARAQFNEFAFDTNNYGGQFMKQSFDSIAIDSMKHFKINTVPKLNLFKNNVKLFEEMVAFSRDKGLEVLIIQVPMYRTYHHRKHPAILRRRDSVVQRLVAADRGIKLLDLERDTLNYHLKDFWNQSHLNPDGARKFSKELNEALNAADLP